VYKRTPEKKHRIFAYIRGQNDTNLSF